MNAVRIWSSVVLAVLVAAGLSPVLFIPSASWQPSTTAVSCGDGSNSITVLESYRTFISVAGTWSVTGLLCNNSQISYTIYSLRISFLDDQGHVIEYVDSPGNYIVPAKESRCFSAGAYMPSEGYKSIRFEQIQPTTRGTISQPYSITSLRFDPSSTQLIGQIRNDNAPIEQFSLPITALLSDAAGKPLSCGWGVVNRATIAKGESTSFRVSFPQHAGISLDPQTAASYTYTVWTDALVSNQADIPPIIITTP